ncbi:alpha-hydroxy acid oxidase [Vineibacter terrae]|uniref:alpha-hydroxy acid oxidase n=1 Tax=Vineibacter terrae TaxID=2586908 RepID=UPI002E375D92|nr:alpha-hydroxy acid oxidase [Vineibacter terrae]HEX2890553.1 alpha-hydroxy acid oxidase [Vineibacter terrae]
MDPIASRRHFLRFMAASPLLAGGGAFGQGAPGHEAAIADPAEALNVFDIEAAMYKTAPPAHVGYLTTGIDDDTTVRANREGFQRLQLRPRRLVDVSRIDMGIELFGTRYDSPIAIAPTGSNKAFNHGGEIAVARAARAGNHLQMLSTVATTAVEDVIAARGAPVWFQLYPTNDPAVSDALVKRAERAGCPVIVVTIDVVARQNWETLARLRRADTRQCGSCHGLGIRDFVARKPNFDGIDVSRISNTGATNLTWDTIKRLRDRLSAKLVLKGILAHEDATLAIEHGVDGIIVSNHGGRAEDSGRATIDALPEILAAVSGRIPVLVDGGVRRGTDIIKALALGARAVGIGRPYLWGLGAFGQPGVERVLQILRRETQAAMQQVGAPAIKDLVPAMVRLPAGVDRP